MKKALICFLVLFLIGGASAAYPYIKDNTLVSGDGERLRGPTFWVFGTSALKDKLIWSQNETAWKIAKDNGFNTIRLACGYWPENPTYPLNLDNFTTLLDWYVAKAEEMDMYVIIDFHAKPGAYNMTNGRAFWNRFAPRYADSEHVIYELTNEPVAWRAPQYTDANLRDFEELWHICDDAAPNVPIIVLSFAVIDNTNPSARQVADRMQGIDWTKTAVGFHSYWNSTSASILNLKTGYPVINTEFMRNDIPTEPNLILPIDGYAYHSTLMEVFGISWVQWDLLSRANEAPRIDALIADLRAHDLYWVDNQSSPSVCGNGITESGEQCDDGNLVNGDGCSSNCQTEVPVPPQTYHDADKNYDYKINFTEIDLFIGVWKNRGVSLSDLIGAIRIWSNGECYNEERCDIIVPECPNGGCDSGETCANCPQDCGPCACVESWSCTNWSACADHLKTRSCTDLNSCGTTNTKPVESQSCEVIPSETDDEVLWLKFENDFKDSSSNSYSVSCVNSNCPEFVSGYSGQAVKFDRATNDGLSISSMPNLIDKTISFWANFDSLETYSMIYSDSASDYAGFLQDGTLRINWDNSTDGNEVTTVPSYAGVAGIWHHYIIVYDLDGNNLEIRFYRDNELIHTTTRSTGLAARSFSTIGIRGTLNTFPGVIDEVKIWDRALNQSEIQVLG